MTKVILSLNLWDHDTKSVIEEIETEVDYEILHQVGVIYRDGRIYTYSGCLEPEEYREAWIYLYKSVPKSLNVDHLEFNEVEYRDEETEL